MILYFFNTLFWSFPLLLLALFKVILPLKKVRLFITRILDKLASNWIAVNSFIQNLFTKTDWQIEQNLELDKDKWYLLLANHQSWVDIMVLQKVFHDKIPFIKFFLKQQLIWFPILGLAWWALDYPFMKRYPKHVLEKNPHLRGKDLEKTRQACL